MNELISVPVSLGELWDKHTILVIKKSKVKDPEKLKHLNKEFKYLKDLCQKYPMDDSLYNKLLEVNTVIWNLEDRIREKEKNTIFDEEFISIARSIYKNNDKRATIKYEINIKYKSTICEVKHY